MIHDIVIDAQAHCGERVRATLGLRSKTCSRAGLGPPRTQVGQRAQGKGSGKRHTREAVAAQRRIGRELKERHLEIQRTHGDKIAKRKTLPVASFSGEILGVLDQYGFCVVCGETGCGKKRTLPVRPGERDRRE